MVVQPYKTIRVFQVTRGVRWVFRVPWWPRPVSSRHFRVWVLLSGPWFWWRRFWWLVVGLFSVVGPLVFWLLCR